ncbi:hypothetical protein BRADI_5g01980v3 [Brachypodium distachyon]|uniref:CASP-like protein n=1 Tax=Brachypodium distachyon TaxID=15368 RepID=I1IVU7_BRADI|nr:hypothetical protein BRADI_5g01980v3 [Brachypodium distachyon]
MLFRGFDWQYRQLQFGIEGGSRILLANASVNVQSFLVAASALLCIWSLSMMILDAYALLVKRLLRHHQLVRLITIGDAIIGALLFTAASASGSCVWHI